MPGDLSSSSMRESSYLVGPRGYLVASRQGFDIRLLAADLKIGRHKGRSLSARSILATQRESTN